MKKIDLLSLVSMIIIGMSFLGCSKEAPSCNDSKTKELVIQIANTEFEEKYGGASLMKFSLENVRSTNKNESVGSYECAANLNAVDPSNSTNVYSIKYTSQLANDGDEFYVEVFGLYF